METHQCLPLKCIYPGLVAVILLLGYGLVTIPRKIWRLANPEARLRWAFHRCG